MKTFFLIVFAYLAIYAQAQLPVQWKYNAKKVGDKTYELHITGAIDKGWHTFSQSQPEDAIALRTVISFNNNPLIQLKGVKLRAAGTTGLINGPQI